MNKRDCIWVAIRIFGIFLLVHALMAIPDFMSAVYQVCNYWSSSPPVVTSSTNAGVRETFSYSQRMIFSSAFAQFIRSSLQVVIYALAGVYLIRGGERLYSWICPSQGDSP